MSRFVIASLALVLALIVAASVYLSRPIFDERLAAVPSTALAIAPISRAVTLAQTQDGAVLLVTSANAEGISAVNLDAYFSRGFDDAVQAYSALGMEQLVRVFAQAPMMQVVPWEALIAPLPSGERAIAAGTNYAEHAREVGHAGEPFLFPKLSAPSAWNAGVYAGTRLDYEIELCVVPLTDYRAGARIELGYILCNDFTDRWLLVRDIDLDGPMGRSGFALGKGGDTRMPVGPLLVIPRGTDFYQGVELSLYVNDRLRQRTLANQMIWSPETILRESLQQCANQYDSAGTVLTLADCDRITAGSVIMTGTPAGVMFKPVTLWAPWAYLGAGDVVKGFGTHLGMLENTVVK